MKIEICKTNKKHIIYIQIHKDIIKHNINTKDIKIKLNVT